MCFNLSLLGIVPFWLTQYFHNVRLPFNMMLPKYLGWLILIPVGMLLLAIQFHSPDPVADSLNSLLSDNNTMSYIGIKPLTSITLFLWEVSGFVSTLAGFVIPIVCFKLSRSS